MDKYAFTRALIIFTLVTFFLGNNLRIFLWLYLICTPYLFIYRVIRFWTKRYLLFILEFCYYGNIIFITFLLWFNDNEIIYSLIFIFSTGNMACSVILFNNQTPFNSTDHLTSCWMHSLQMLANWAIRWKHNIYLGETLKNLKFNFYDYGNISFEFNDFFKGLLIYPLIFWVLWALIYIIFMGLIFKSYVNDSRFNHGLIDFKNIVKNVTILGDINSNTIMKYIFLHFGYLCITTILALISFYNFYFHTVYVILI